MCTLSIYRDDDIVRITMNRDERRTRADEIPPKQWDDPNMIAPVDSQRGGTWIGVNADGVWACLLNGYLEHIDDADFDASVYESRGTLIPEALASDDPVILIEQKDLSPFQSFRLLIGDENLETELYWDTKTLHKEEYPLNGWMFRTSSSWNQSEVQEFRKNFFERWKERGAEHNEHGVPLVHLLTQQGKDSWTPYMSRERSCTRSISQILIPRNGKVLFKYWPVQNIVNQPQTVELMKDAA